jgi:hypothetical protein
MKLNQESSSLLTLKDYNISQFVFGILFVIIGIAIAVFLANGEYLMAIAFGVVFALSGLWMLISTKLVSISLDKGLGRAKFSLRSILKNKSRELSIQQIKSLTLMKEIDNSSKGNMRRQFTLRFVLDNGEEIPFEFGSLTGGMDVLTSPEANIRKQAQQVAEFLGVPLKRVGPPSTSEVLSTIKDVLTTQLDKSKKS